MKPSDRFSLLLSRTCLVGCLLGLTSTLYFFAGVSGYVNSPLPNIATAIAVLFAALFFLYSFFVLLPDKSRLGFAIWSLILMVLLAEIVLGLVPPTARDELSHHLAMPRLYAKAGRILEVPFAPYSYYPALLDMLYTPFVQWGWDSIPKLIHGLFGFLTALLLYAYFAHRLHPIYGLLSFFLFVSTPAVLRLSSWAYVDLGLTFYSTSALLCLLLWTESVENRRWFLLAGLSAGFAMATKPNGLLVFLPLFFLLALFLGREKERGLRETTSWLSLFLLVALIPLGPWIAKNLIWTGNPFFPFLTGLFGGQGEWASEPSLGIFSTRQLLYDESGWQIAAFPLRVFFSGQDDSPQYFDGVLNPILILFLPWAFKGKWLREKRAVFAFVFLYFLYAFFFVDLRIRYLLPIVPPLVILLVYGIHNVYLRMRLPSLLFAVMILLVALNGVYLWNYFHVVSPSDYLRGRESRESYLARMLPEYPAIQYINQKLPSMAKIYFIFVGRRVYYSERNYFHDGGDNPRFLLKAIQGARDEGEIQVKLQQQGITHLLVQQELLRRFLANNLTPRERGMWEKFQDRYLRALFGLRGYELYEIGEV